MGFGAKIEEKKDIDYAKIFSQVEPDDLIRFGIIPELIGRLPMITSLGQLDKKALKSILTQPKNALVKQYKKLLKMDNIDLKFSKNTLDKIV